MRDRIVFEQAWLITGTNDRIVNNTAFDDLPWGQRFDLPCGHLLEWERPDEVAGIIVQALGEE